VILFLSPHLDDAVLSCPARIQRLLARGFDVRIVTIFSTGPGAPALYRKRRAEDREAVRELGGSPIHVGMPDAPFRSPTYAGFCGIVFGRAREYSATCRVLSEAFGRLLSRFCPERIFAPMAAGNHVDHRLVRDAALRSFAPQHLRFYEDRPYAFIREQVEHVLGIATMASQPAQFWERYFATTYVRQYRGSTTEARMIRGWQSVPSFPSPHRLRLSDAIESNEGECARSLAAISAYRTEVPYLFADENECKALYESQPERIYRID
jgi:LmbE family N-acetylglucosaminyl deacetylase